MEDKFRELIALIRSHPSSIPGRAQRRDEAAHQNRTTDGLEKKAIQHAAPPVPDPASDPTMAAIMQQGQKELEEIRQQEAFKQTLQKKQECYSREHFSKIDTSLMTPAAFAIPARPRVPSTLTTQGHISNYSHNGQGTILDIIALAVNNHLHRYPRHIPDVIYIHSSQLMDLYNELRLRYRTVRPGMCYFATGEGATETISIKTEQDLPTYIGKSTLPRNGAICQQFD